MRKDKCNNLLYVHSCTLHSHCVTCTNSICLLSAVQSARVHHIKISALKRVKQSYSLAAIGLNLTIMPKTNLDDTWISLRTQMLKMSKQSSTL